MAEEKQRMSSHFQLKAGESLYSTHHSNHQNIHWNIGVASMDENGFTMDMPASEGRVEYHVSNGERTEYGTFGGIKVFVERGRSRNLDTGETRMEEYVNITLVHYEDQKFGTHEDVQAFMQSA